jgi:chemotaxis response regulator CheB
VRRETCPGKFKIGKTYEKKNFTTITAYIDHVSSNKGKDEFINFVNSLSTNFTSFYRENDHFDYLTRTLLPKLIQKKQHIVQHMPAQFTTSFAQRLNGISNMDVKEAVNGDSVLNGQVLLAPGGYHMVLKRSGAKYYVEIKKEPQVCHQCPSVEVLFYSVAQIAGANSVGVMLTGIGEDGAKAMVELHNNGARTIAQDEKSCVVYGMPKRAVELGDVDHICTLDKIAEKIKFNYQTDALNRH